MRIGIDVRYLIIVFIHYGFAETDFFIAISKMFLVSSAIFLRKLSLVNVRRPPLISTLPQSEKLSLSF